MHEDQFTFMTTSLSIRRRKRDFMGKVYISSKVVGSEWLG